MYTLSNGMTVPYFLQVENDRNTHNGLVFIEIIRRAFETDEVVMVGHHFVFEPAAAMKVLDLTKLNEIPSADTLIFCHPIMTAVFGADALPLMAHLSQVPSEERETILRAALAKLPPLPSMSV